MLVIRKSVTPVNCIFLPPVVSRFRWSWGEKLNPTDIFFHRRLFNFFIQCLKHEQARKKGRSGRHLFAFWFGLYAYQARGLFIWAYARGCNMESLLRNMLVMFVTSNRYANSKYMKGKWIEALTLFFNNKKGLVLQTELLNQHGFKSFDVIWFTKLIEKEGRKEAYKVSKKPWKYETFRVEKFKWHRRSIGNIASTFFDIALDS